MTQHGFAVSGHDHLGHKTSVNSDRGIGLLRGKRRMEIGDSGSAYSHHGTEKGISQYTGVFAGTFHGIIYRPLLSGAVQRFAGWWDYCGHPAPNPVQRQKTAGQCLCRIGKGKNPARFCKSWRSAAITAVLKGGHPYDWLTRSTQIVDQYAADPYCTFLFTASGFQDLFTLYGLANDLKTYRAVPKTFPLLIVSGGDDPVGNNGKPPTQGSGMFQQTGHIDVTLRLYPGGRHEILNETNRCEVYDGIAAWVNGGFHNRKKPAVGRISILRQVSSCYFIAF